MRVCGFPEPCVFSASMTGKSKAASGAGEFDGAYLTDTVKFIGTVATKLWAVSTGAKEEEVGKEGAAKGANNVTEEVEEVDNFRSFEDLDMLVRNPLQPLGTSCRLEDGPSIFHGGSGKRQRLTSSRYTWCAWAPDPGEWLRPGVHLGRVPAALPEHAALDDLQRGQGGEDHVPHVPGRFPEPLPALGQAHRGLLLYLPVRGLSRGE